MLDTWNESIFSNIKNRLQDSAMKLVHAERLGEAFDSQLVIGVRESYGEKRSSVWIKSMIQKWTVKIPAGLSNRVRAGKNEPKIH